MQRHDRAALTQALTLCRNESVGRAQQIDSMLEDEPWAEVAQFAAFVCQGRALHLDPWESPPCWSDEGDNDTAAKLLREMLALGVSRWHPDPLAALEAAKRNSAA